MPEMAAELPSGKSEQESMPAMSFLEHLEELRRRLIYSIISVVIGFFLCWGYAENIVGWMQKPIMEALQRNKMPQTLVYLNPTDPFNLYLKVGLLAGLFVACPFVLYQLWMFISPGLYRHEKRYVLPFMFSTIFLFLSGGFFGYKLVYPAALDFLIKFGHQFQPTITITEYTQLFFSIVLGMGIIFELPILVFFLAFLGIVSPGFMLKHFRYAVLIIFIIAAIITPTPDVFSMCVFASPMLGLYALSVGVAWVVHPKQRAARQAKRERS